MIHLAPEYVYTPAGLQANMLVSITDQGLISSIAPRDALGSQSVAPFDVETLPGKALLPGFVNVHSHVFQRALRGHTHRPLSTKDTFWTWRNAMYAEAQRLNPDSLYELALRTYREMLAAGYTTVGEFHYVHHQPGGQPYANPNAMAEALLQAGREAGLRVVLLMTAYSQAGFNQPPEEGQRRFCDTSVEAYLSRVEMLRAKGVPIGVAPHSVRAVPELWFRAIADYSRTHHLPLHVHAGEQLAEIHATHASDEEIALLAQHGSAVCVCPTTEGDLGDGIAPYAAFLAAKLPLSIGSDSNTRLDPFEELRWAEYSARMRYQRRRVLVAGELASPGPLLLNYGTRSGAMALGIEAGIIAPGMSADFNAVDINHPVMAGWTANDFLDTLFFGASSEVITQTWVQGKRVEA